MFLDATDTLFMTCVMICHVIIKCHGHASMESADILIINSAKLITVSVYVSEICSIMKFECSYRLVQKTQCKIVSSPSC